MSEQSKSEETGIAAHQPTARFTNRAAIYDRFRPRYPAAILTTLIAETGLTPADEIADAGCGTGISSRLFLENGNRVYGIEPNEAMRTAGVEALQGYPRFVSLAGSAEATTLPAGSVDYVVAGQAFHWFEPESARAEFVRILRPGGWIALFWNSRRVDASPFMAGYEALVKRHSRDFAEVQHGRLDDAVFSLFFANHDYAQFTFNNPYRLDFEAVLGRTASTSYMPAPDEPDYTALSNDLRSLFDQHADEAGHLRFDYQTDLYFGRV